MSRLVRALLRGAVRAHPAPWRDRYGDEVGALLADLDPRLSDIIDLAGSALPARLAAMLPGGAPVTSSTNPWPGRVLAVAALVLAGWTVVFIGFNVLRYNLGVPVPESLASTYATGSPIPAMLGVLGPAVIGLGLAVAGMARVTRPRTDGGSAFLVRVRPTRLTVLAALACIGVALVIIGYVASENLLEALR